MNCTSNIGRSAQSLWGEGEEKEERGGGMRGRENNCVEGREKSALSANPY